MHHDASGLKSYLARRRSVPAVELKGPGPDADMLAEILTLASRVPDHGKLAPWRFIVFEGEARAAAGEALARLLAERDGVGDPDRLAAERGQFTKAPLVVAVVSTARHHPKIPQWEQVVAAGAVGLNLIHAAAAHGLAAQWLTGWAAYDPDALALLGVKPAERLVGFFHVGRADRTPEDRTRPDVAALTTRYAGA